MTKSAHVVGIEEPKDSSRAAPVPGRGAAVDWSGKVYEVLRRVEIRQVAYVPDAGHARLINLCHADPAMKTVVLTSEQEGIGVLSGAWLGGERGVLLMQSSGIGNCINNFAMVNVCDFPLLMLVTMRGEWGEFNPWQVPMGRTSRASLKLAGMTVYEVCEAEHAEETVEAAARIAFNSCQGAAVLFSQRMLGTKLFKD